MIVKRRISLGYRLQLIIEIDDNLTERDHEMQFYTIAAHVFLIYELTSFVETKLHYRTDIIGISNDRSLDVRLLYMVDECRIRQPRRIVNLFRPTLLVIYHI